MTDAIFTDPTTKIDAVLLFDVAGGNPNGDPDLENQPRQDPRTGHGIVTNGSIKRKIRDFVAQTAGDRPDHEGLNIWIAQGSVLNDAIAAGYDDLNIKIPKGGKGSPDEQAAVQAALKARFWDLRMFGGVLSTGLHAGQVWGPVQVCDARSISAIEPQNLSITRCAATEGKEGKDNKTMGRKWHLPYGLYRTTVSYSPYRANSGAAVTPDDLALLWDSLVWAWENSASATRGRMGCRGLYLFAHDRRYGSAPVHELEGLVSIAPKVAHPRGFEDYEVAIGEAPEGVLSRRW